MGRQHRPGCLYTRLSPSAFAYGGCVNRGHLVGGVVVWLCQHAVALIGVIYCVCWGGILNAYVKASGGRWYLDKFVPQWRCLD